MNDRNIGFIVDCLRTDDDESFWRTACAVFFKDAVAFKKKGIPLFLEIGLCSLWINQSQRRFSDTQIMPLPEQSAKDKTGYARLTMPSYDWSMMFYYDPEEGEWKAGDISAGDFMCLRCSLPAKTATLSYAVGHTAWITGNDMSRPMLYSFKKSADKKWDCFINPLNKS